MTLHADLLDQARHLARRESRRPRQASLRRSISAAYYSLFHLLIADASRTFVRDERLANSISRVYAHRQMHDISQSFAGGHWPTRFDTVKAAIRIPQELRDVARAFVDLQQARHDADYNLAKKFTRNETLAFVQQAEDAFATWDEIRKSDLARIYLASFLLWEQWNKAR